MRFGHALGDVGSARGRDRFLNTTTACCSPCTQRQTRRLSMGKFNPSACSCRQDSGRSPSYRSRKVHRFAMLSRFLVVHARSLLCRLVHPEILGPIDVDHGLVLAGPSRDHLDSAIHDPGWMNHEEGRQSQELSIRDSLRGGGRSFHLGVLVDIVLVLLFVALSGHATRLALPNTTGPPSHC